MLWVELCIDQGVTYEKYIEQPDWFIQAHFERFVAGGGKEKLT